MSAFDIPEVNIQSHNYPSLSYFSIIAASELHLYVFAGDGCEQE